MQADVNFLNAVNDFMDALIYETNQIVSAVGGTVPVIHAQAKHNVADSFRDVMDAKSSVTFYDTTDVVRPAIDVTDNLNELRDELDIWRRGDSHTSPAGADEFRKWMKQQNDTFTELNKPRIDFVNAARNELGLPPLDASEIINYGAVAITATPSDPPPANPPH